MTDSSPISSKIERRPSIIRQDTYNSIPCFPPSPPLPIKLSLFVVVPSSDRVVPADDRNVPRGICGICGRHGRTLRRRRRLRRRNGNYRRFHSAQYSILLRAPRRNPGHTNPFLSGSSQELEWQSMSPTGQWRGRRNRPGNVSVHETAHRLSQRVCQGRRRSVELGATTNH